MVAAPACLVDAVLSELRLLAARLPGVEGSPMAWVALQMAREVDDPENSATSKSFCAGKVLEALGELRALVPEEKAGDGLDELAAKRGARLAAAR